MFEVTAKSPKLRMNFYKILIPLVAVSLTAGCSLTGTDSAFVQDGPSSTTVYTVQPGDTLYSISRRYGLDPVRVARDNALSNPSLLAVGQKLRLTVGSGTEEAISRVQAATTTPVATAKPTQTNAQPEVEKPAPASDGKTVTAQAGSGKFMWPASGKVVQGIGENHNGFDIATAVGTPVKAAGDGQVVYVGNQEHFGKIVMVAHSGDYVSVYGHNSNISVKSGDKVTKGQTIATSGKKKTGEAVVHFEIRKKGKVVNPSTLIQ